MNNSVKIGIYIVLAIAALWFGTRFYSEFKQRSDAAAIDTSEDKPEVPTTTNATSETTNTPEAPTNAVASTTNTTETAETSVPPTNQDTNTVAESTNSIVPPSTAVATAGGGGTQTAGTVKKGKWMANLGAFLGVIIVLGLLV